ncbi:MAG: hypothetical protein LQ337_005925 [Flavoplaca oasis]|nr:MAG: hypothetical protein LQ337_005925 [Flavoplaca oasis]
MPPFRPTLARPIQCLRSPRCSQTNSPVRTRFNLQPTRTFSSAPLGHQKPSRPFKPFAIASGVLGASLFIYYIRITSYRDPQQLDAPRPSSTSPSNNPSAPIHITRDPDENLIPTGTSTIPFFPRTINLPSSTTETTTSTATRTLPYGTGPSTADTSEEYQLLGLGIRKVSFLRIQVYVVGLYIARSDLPKLQESLVRAYFTSNASGDSTVSSATTLVDNEKSELRELLLGGASEKGGRGEKIWDEVLREAGVKSVLRIVPTRATDFGHMREGWVRSINNRSGPKSLILMEKEKIGLDESVNNFKAIFGGGRKGVGKGKVLMMRRGAQGELGVWMEEDVPEVAEQQPPETTKGKGRKLISGQMSYLGGLKDERISRLVWLGYLAGQNVASDGARKSVVEGVMDIVERPIGTIDTQVI